MVYITTLREALWRSDFDFFNPPVSCSQNNLDQPFCFNTVPTYSYGGMTVRIFSSSSPEAARLFGEPPLRRASTSDQYFLSPARYEESEGSLTVATVPALSLLIAVGAVGLLRASRFPGLSREGFGARTFLNGDSTLLAQLSRDFEGVTPEIVEELIMTGRNRESVTAQFGHERVERFNDRQRMRGALSREGGPYTLPEGASPTDPRQAVRLWDLLITTVDEHGSETGILNSFESLDIAIRDIERALLETRTQNGSPSLPPTATPAERGSLYYFNRYRESLSSLSEHSSPEQVAAHHRYAELALMEIKLYVYRAYRTILTVQSASPTVALS